MNEPVKFDDATRPQVKAADPQHSSWVSANAGSGKTKVLTDRVARLLLSGTPPQRILCLTYTTAAASNMQIRLFDRLGGWSMLSDRELRDQLARLGEDLSKLDQERLRRARTLFARALETPGGLRIETIHAFASAILRRFPLEAGVSPQFASLEDRAASNLRSEVLDRVAETSPEALGKVARYINGFQLGEFVQEIFGKRVSFARDVADAEIDRIFGLESPLGSAETEIQSVFTRKDRSLIKILLTPLREGGVSDTRALELLSHVKFANPGRSDFNLLQVLFLYGKSAKHPFGPKVGRFPTQGVRAALGPVRWRQLDEYMKRVSAARSRILQLEAAEKTRTLHQFARTLLTEYARRKRQASALDFEDLILKTLELLSNPETAQWVLYKLDGGIDHILVDEAQDVSRTQWSIISRIAEEFTAGTGARDRDRTVFAVGDEKQSIYGFQGAAPEKFVEMRSHFQSRYEASGLDFVRETLKFSFRSSPAILNIVDSMFERRGEPGFAGSAAHKAFKPDLPGRVDLWPFIENPERPDQPEWYATRPVSTTTGAPQQLARKLAAEIRRMTDPQRPTHIRSGGRVRPVEFGDILILVRRRNELFHLIISELKTAGLPVAGTDRMQLAEELAVKDIRAILSFLATQSDDLSLAAVLRSPIFQMTEEELFSIANGRGKQTLWQSLQGREHEFPETIAILRDLLGQANRLKPYELVEYLLTVHRGRERLIARLGAVVSEPVDALLQQAIAYDAEEPSSLTGFLDWSASEFEIKRQLDQAGNEIRVMTVHGAKGLESPIVILPDTADRRLMHGTNDLLTSVDGVPLWNVATENRIEVLAAAVEEADVQAENEHLRLLYVALTRAESWLIVAGAGRIGNDSWYKLVHIAMIACDAPPVTSDAFPDDVPPEGLLRYSHGEWPDAGDRLAAPAGSQEPLPDWVHDPAPGAEQPPAFWSPSGLGGDKSIYRKKSADGPPDRDQEATERGTMVHLLLEHLPASATGERRDRARQILEGCNPQITDEMFEEIHDEAVRMLDNPEFAAIFGPSSIAEVGITAGLAGLNGDTILGFVDRLVIEKDRVLAVDFKSNAIVPSGERDVPEGILRQLGAYQESLAAIYPDRRIVVAILWTRTGELMPIDPELCRSALGRAGDDLNSSDETGRVPPETEFDAFGEMFK